MHNRITLAQIIDLLGQLSKRIDPASFIFDFLICFGAPRATIVRLQRGSLNSAKKPGGLLLKTKIYFESTGVGSNLQQLLKDAVAERQIKANRVRFVVVTDFKTLYAHDVSTGETTHFPIRELHEHYVFFLPLAGMEQTRVHAEAEADVRAAEHMAKLYDLILADNPPKTKAERHSLNVFLTRLLFCYFAEDTGIFPQNSFTSAVSQFTQGDGSDLGAFLTELFLHLNAGKRTKVREHLAPFPYVNGGLFRDTQGRHSIIPQFTTRSRNKLIELGEKSWKDINPDIFGSMFQGVVDPEQRAELGMHYTSVPNIMKVIRPLFLDDLYEELNRAKANGPKLRRLLERIYRAKFFDPACGSGNFLIIAYKELRRLEMAVFAEILKLEGQLPLSLSQIQVSQFHGIEIDDFAAEVGVLAMWLAEHQMNLEFESVFGKMLPSLPLKDSARIVCGNATTLDWNDICRNSSDTEVFVFGNPPYYGARNQTPQQKSEVEHVFDFAPEHKDADFICCWILKGCSYIVRSNAQLAFVSTNSVCQGDHIGILWPRILDQRLELGFAHTAFKWTNSAKGKAGVTCVILGIRNVVNRPKWIYHESVRTSARNINPYLADAPNIIVGRRDIPLTPRLDAVMGSMARDGGALILSESEMREIAAYPQAKGLIRPLLGTKEFIDGLHRWCLWISNEQLKSALTIPVVKMRIDAVFEFRNESTAKTTNGYAAISHQFAQRAHQDGPAIMIPRTTSERRTYIPLAYFSDNCIITDSAHAIYQAPLWLFALLSSKMHMVWAKAVAGGLELRVRYSSWIVYNNFPFPELSASSRSALEAHATRILLVRENYPQKTISWLYDPDTMPLELLKAHHDLDAAVEQSYRSRAFGSDEERLNYLFEQYVDLARIADGRLL